MRGLPLRREADTVILPLLALAPRSRPAGRRPSARVPFYAEAPALASGSGPPRGEMAPAPARRSPRPSSDETRRAPRQRARGPAQAALLLRTPDQLALPPARARRRRRLGPWHRRRRPAPLRDRPRPEPTLGPPHRLRRTRSAPRRAPAGSPRGASAPQRPRGGLTCVPVRGRSDGPSSTPNPRSVLLTSAGPEETAVAEDAVSTPGGGCRARRDSPGSRACAS
jgi:hypothetical protein